MTSILVVDDEELVALTIERVLRPKYQVQIASSGSEALKAAHRIQPSLIILDIVMPGMDGLQTCREIRSDPTLQSIPILFLTGLAGVEDKIEGFEAGADDYLAKPFNIRELSLRVKAILRRTGMERQENRGEDSFGPRTLEAGKLKLDCGTFEVTTPEKTASLTPVEFDVLCHLMSHEGQVFSSERLLHELWDYPSDAGSPDLVRMHIRNLRVKIEPDTKNPRYILTIPRHGYTVGAR